MTSDDPPGHHRFDSNCSDNLSSTKFGSFGGTTGLSTIDSEDNSMLSNKRKAKYNVVESIIDESSTKSPDEAVHARFKAGHFMSAIFPL